MSIYDNFNNLEDRKNVGTIQGELNVGSIEHTQNIRAGLPVAKTKYGITINEYDYLDLAIDFLRDVRHFGATDYYAVVKSDESGNISLPCNLKSIEGLMTYRIGLQKYDNRILYTIENKLGGMDNFLAQLNIVDELLYWPDQTSSKRNGDGYVSYRFVDGRTINVKAPNITLILAYNGLTVDAEGFPFITRKQANGIAGAVLHQQTLLKAIKGDKNAVNMISYTTQESGRLKQAASIPEEITDNELDEVLNAKTSFNRKTFRRPSKFSR